MTVARESTGSRLEATYRYVVRQFQAFPAAENRANSCHGLLRTSPPRPRVLSQAPSKSSPFSHHPTHLRCPSKCSHKPLPRRARCQIVVATGMGQRDSAEPRSHQARLNRRAPRKKKRCFSGMQRFLRIWASAEQEQSTHWCPVRVPGSI